MLAKLEERVFLAMLILVTLAFGFVLGRFCRLSVGMELLGAVYPGGHERADGGRADAGAFTHREAASHSRVPDCV